MQTNLRDCTSMETNQCLAHFLMEEIAVHMFECSDVSVDCRPDS